MHDLCGLLLRVHEAIVLILRFLEFDGVPGREVHEGNVNSSHVALWHVLWRHQLGCPRVVVVGLVREVGCRLGSCVEASSSIVRSDHV